MATKDDVARSAPTWARYIDHTLLAATATGADIERLCAEAKEFGFFSVCVNSSFVGAAKTFLLESAVKVCSAIGFPLGANSGEVKAFEADRALADGADELDMVLHLGHLKAAEWNLVLKDVRAVVSVANTAPVKVILETCLLTDAEKIRACQIAAEAGATFVKTSTGFASGGATVHDVRLLRANIPPHMQVKASGGIRDLRALEEMVAAGASRIGTSNGVKILSGGAASAGY